MKRFLTLALVGALVLGASSVVYANICAFDAAPAATLLFPFVAYNYDMGDDGITTLFSITNVSSEATIAHVTLWTDYSVSILDFNILLTGYDVQRINIRDILRDGLLPVTKIRGNPTTAGVNDDGPISEANTALDWTFVSPLDNPQATTVLATAGRCLTSDTGYPGNYENNPIPGTILDLFQGWLQSSQTVDRAYTDYCGVDDDGYQPPRSEWFTERTTADDTWMYITVDVVDDCNLLFPDQSQYWTPATVDGPARYDNILIGDVIWVSNADRLSEASTAVHIEADEQLANVATIVPTSNRPASFYHRYSQFNDIYSDFREPLPNAWAFRYQGASNANQDTYIRAWKGSTVNLIVPDLYTGLVAGQIAPTELISKNIAAYTYYAWDEAENVLTADTNPWSSPIGGAVIPNLLPLETQEVSVEQLNTVADAGWMLFVWPASNYTPGAPALSNCYDWYQTWMGVKFTKIGDYSAFTEGSVMANFNCFQQQTLDNGLGIAFDYVDAAGYVTSVAPAPAN